MLKNVTFSYDKLVYKNISIANNAGITAIAGQSGCGKTTLLKTIAGLIIPDSGDVTRSVRIGMVFQEPRLFPWFTVEKNLGSILKSVNIIKEEKQQRIDKALATVGLLDYKNHYPTTLSGGMKMRVSIARALVYEAEVLLLDEPFNGLDIASKDTIIQLLRNLAKDGLKMVFVSHIPEDIISIADNIYILSPRPSKVVDIFTNPLMKTKQFNNKIRKELIQRIKSGVANAN